jgi:hypothetical protein
MDKEQVKAELGVSIRRVEQFASEGRLGEVKYVRSKTGKKADYDPEAVERLKAELETPDAPLEAPQGRATGLVVASQVEAARRFAEVIADALRPVDTRPVLVTKAQAVEMSGLPVSWIELAVRAGRLASFGRGVARRLRRDEVLALAASEDLPALVEQWRNGGSVGE